MLLNMCYHSMHTLSNMHIQEMNLCTVCACRTKERECNDNAVRY